MLHDGQFDVRQYQKEKDKLESEARLRNILTGGVYVTDESFDKEIEQFE